MNQKELAIQRNNAARLLDLNMKGKRNAIYLGNNESKAHAMKKAEVCIELYRLGKEFYTECVFKNRKGKADIIVLDDCLALEIVESEEEESIEKKEMVYPCRIVKIEVLDIFTEEMLL